MGGADAGAAETTLTVPKDKIVAALVSKGADECVALEILDILGQADKENVSLDTKRFKDELVGMGFNATIADECLYELEAAPMASTSGADAAAAQTIKMIPVLKDRLICVLTSKGADEFAALEILDILGQADKENISLDTKRFQEEMVGMGFDAAVAQECLHELEAAPTAPAQDDHGAEATYDEGDDAYEADTQKDPTSPAALSRDQSGLDQSAYTDGFTEDDANSPARTQRMTQATMTSRKALRGLVAMTLATMTTSRRV